MVHSDARQCTHTHNELRKATANEMDKKCMTFNVYRVQWHGKDRVGEVKGEGEKASHRSKPNPACKPDRGIEWLKLLMTQTSKFALLMFECNPNSLSLSPLLSINRSSLKRTLLYPSFFTQTKFLLKISLFFHTFWHVFFWLTIFSQSQY